MSAPGLRLGANALGIALGLAGLGLSMGVIASSAATPEGALATVFTAYNLVPGGSATGRILVPSGKEPLAPFLRASQVVDGSVTSTSCRPGGPRLSDTVELLVRAPNGQSWTGTPNDLRTITRLPGGELRPNSGSRPYGVTLSLPSTATNGSSGCTLAFQMQWGGMNAAGRPVVVTEGGGSVRGLPSTGVDVVIQTIAGLSLLVTGMVLLLVGRRGRRSDVV